MININENIVPLDFSWRSGAGRESTKYVENKPQILSGGYYPVYFRNEYFESLWYELGYEINDNLQKFLFEPMTSTTYGNIFNTIDLTITQFSQKYKEFYSIDFLMALDSISKELENRFYFDVRELQIQTGPYPRPMKLIKDAIYVDETLNTILINPSYIIYKIKSLNHEYSNSYINN